MKKERKSSDPKPEKIISVIEKAPKEARQIEWLKIQPCKLFIGVVNHYDSLNKATLFCQIKVLPIYKKTC